MGRPRARKLILLTLVALAASEVALRGWGFGRPVLYEWDARFEYRMVPDQVVWRFGKRIETNDLGLRCHSVPAAKADPAELRVLVVGDSVVNAGSHVDQSQLGTELLERLLDEQLARPVRVINVSANSWGPQNQLEFLKAFGTFDADIAVVVLSSHDLVDLPAHGGEAKANSGNTFNAPWCALSEVAGLVWHRVVPSAAAPLPDETDPVRGGEGLLAFESLLDHLTSSVPHVAVAMHWDRAEQQANAPRPAHATLVDAAGRASVPVWELGPAFIAAASNAPNSSTWPVMHDRIHPSELGQSVLAHELFRRLEESGWYADVIDPR
jgi:hypothetical protein